MGVRVGHPGRIGRRRFARGASFRIPRRMANGWPQDPPPIPKHWRPSWIRLNHYNLMGMLSGSMSWDFGGTCGEPKGNHGLPCACHEGRISEMVHKNNALLRMLNR